MDRFSAWLRAHGWTLLILLFLPLAGMALFPFAHSLLSSGKTPPVAMSDEDQLVLFVTGGCGLLLMGFLLLAYSRNRNARLRQESMERSLEYQKLITEATKGLYESIYEVDVTRDRADSEETRHYFERLGISGDTPFGEALRHIAATQLREEDRRGYLATFSPDRVLRAYREGVRSLRYEFMISEDGKNYYWLRIIARIFVLPFDQSVRMIVYRQNIDEEKHHWKAYQYQEILMEAAKGLYENIYEMDMTHNCAANEETRAYFESLGLPGDAAYDRFLHHVAEKQIKAEHRQRYLDAFLSDNVLAAHASGTDRRVCEVMLSTDGGEAYYWLRITARIFFWDEDKSVRIFSFRQNINEEKKRECRLSAQARLDPLTGLCNKAATEQHISETLAACKAEDRRFAFFILDIDDFKRVNDDFGHAVGDMVIREFALELKRQFRDTDVAGRIGGDEFAAFLPVPGRAWVERKASKLGAALRKSFMSETYAFGITASIGIALAPRDGKDFATLYRNADAALYQAKKRGKDGFSVHAGA
ncbi:MAG: GGDEF domain-containing protein [Desulfovibrio fairfieldensis]|nr:GGDEF domain-containing protein [Desulfovibrio fairfieldensis]